MTSRQPTASRGSVYLPVLGTAMLVSVIGLAALLGARVQRQAAGAESDVSAARANARTAVEVAMLTVQQDPAWRKLGTDWVTGRAVAGGSLSIKALDPVDGDLTNNSTDPVELTGIGTAGDARHVLRVTMAANGGLAERTPALLSGGTITVTATDVRGDGFIAANGAVFASDGAVVNPDLETAATATGSTYAGAVEENVPSRSILDGPTFAALYLTSATRIDADLLQAPAVNFLSNGTFESGVDPWFRYDRKGALNVDSGARTGSQCLQVWDRQNDYTGPAQDILEQLRSPGPFRITAWARVKSGSADFRISCAYWTDRRNTVRGPRITVGERWTEISWDWNWIPVDGLTRAEIFLYTLGSTEEYWLDDVEMIHTGGASSRTLAEVVLSPTTNPFGQPDPDGIYVIDCGGVPLTIRDCRIVGTLILEQPGSDSRVEGSMVWEAATPGQPTLIVPSGSLTIATRDVPLSESALGVNFNPDAVPYPWDGGADADADFADVYESRLRGLIHIGGSLAFTERPVLTAVVRSTGSITMSAERLEINLDESLNSTPDDDPPILELVAGSWERIVEP